jgi:hypothetical protein
MPRCEGRQPTWCTWVHRLETLPAFPLSSGYQGFSGN